MTTLYLCSAQEVLEGSLAKHTLIPHWELQTIGVPPVSSLSTALRIPGAYSGLPEGNGCPF